MATAALIPVEQYLRTSYRPDCDYVDGEVKERNLGTRPHAALQGILFAIFNANRSRWGALAFTELRVRVGTKRYRIPDVTVLSASDPADDVVEVAPMICIEVLSPDDTLPDMQERADDYETMGVPYIWIFDPVKKRAWVATSSGLQKVVGDTLSAGPAITLILPEIFSELDELTGRAS